MGDVLPAPVRALTDAGYHVTKGKTGSVYFVFNTPDKRTRKLVAVVMIDQPEPAPPERRTRKTRSTDR